MKTYEGLLERLARSNEAGMLLAVIDGLGDLPMEELGGRTPLEAARTPNLDGLALRGALGMHVPVAPGITPGSGPAHLGLFGYDPVEYRVGRGVLAALGVGFPLEQGDLAARINFCTVDADGTVVDRRAGRISTDRCRELVNLLREITVDGVEIHLMPVKQHRACVVFRGEGLTEEPNDTDPGLVGEKPLPINGYGRSGEVARKFLKAAAEILRNQHPANYILLRGFALYKEFPSMARRFLLKPAAVALYPMYRGVARLVGMDVLESSPENLEGQAETVARAVSEGYDYVFVHHKPADSAGEDGDHEAKVRAIEEFDAALPRFLENDFSVVVVTGDHSTPCSMKLHSWHPVPVLFSGEPLRRGYSSAFSEREALKGAMGTFHSVDIIGLMMAVAGKLSKFGA